MNSNLRLSVDKRVVTDEYGAPAIVYELRYSGTDSTRVRLREEVPDQFDPEQFGFHRQYHADAWWVGDGTLVFEHSIEPDETLETVVGVCTPDPDRLEPLLSEPVVEIASATGGEGTNWGQLSDARVDYGVDADAITTPSVAATDGGEASLAGADGAEDGESDSQPANASGAGQTLADEADPDAIESAIPSVEETSGSQGDAEWPADGGRDELVDRFVDELADDSLSDDQRRRLREALGVDSITSMDARIDHCQKRLSDLDAYVDALEAFLDEEGNGQELIEGFRTDVAAVESGLAALEADVDETADEQQDLRDRIDGVEDEVAELRAVRDDVAALQRELDETAAELRDEIDELRATVERFEEWQTNLASAFEDLSSPDA